VLLVAVLIGGHPGGEIPFYNAMLESDPFRPFYHPQCFFFFFFEMKLLDVYVQKVWVW
jgi:hypothetical protein